jgi:hypothetical protein
LEVIEIDIPHKRPDVFRIYPIGDIHKGSPHCDENKIEEQIALISQDKNARIIGMGDYTDCILANDKRFDIEGFAPWCKRDNIVESQREAIVKLFTPVKDKILCLLTGNHEETIHTYYQDDITRNICKDLGVRYGGYSAYIVPNFVRSYKADGASNCSKQYTIHAWHGAGASQSDGAVMMRLMSLVNEIQADIYLMGHLHKIVSHTPERLFLFRGKVKSRPLIATCTGSWVKTYTQSVSSINYAEKKGYKPSRIGCPVISIKPDVDKVTLVI